MTTLRPPEPSVAEIRRRALRRERWLHLRAAGVVLTLASLVFWLLPVDGAAPVPPGAVATPSDSRSSAGQPTH